jgi:hypothetical protein
MELITYVIKNHIAHFVVSLRVLYMCIEVLSSLSFNIINFTHSLQVKSTDSQIFLRWRKETHVLPNQNPLG